jgi:hypothetical protein
VDCPIMFYDPSTFLTTQEASNFTIIRLFYLTKSLLIVECVQSESIRALIRNSSLESKVLI